MSEFGRAGAPQELQVVCDSVGDPGSVGSSQTNNHDIPRPLSPFHAAAREKDLRIVLMGVPLHRVLPSPGAQFGFLVAVLLAVSMSFAALQERVLYVPGFKYPGWMAFNTSLTYVLCAVVEKVFTRELGRTGSMVEYTKLSVLTMGGMYFTNWSLRYLSYPLRVVFKSSKIIPVMALSVLYTKRSYTLVQYLSVILLSIGLVIFTLGDAKGKASFDARGMLLIAIGSVAEAFAANFEEQRLFNVLGCSPTEVILYSNLVGLAWAACADLCSGELWRAIVHSANHPEVILIIDGAAITGYAAQSVIMVLIKNFGATITELVKSCRKILTVCISFLIYGKPWTLMHVAGGLLFTASVALERYAAGGTSRRFASLLFFASTFFTTWILSGTGPSRYSIVIDAGGMGTRLHVFRFDAWTSELLPLSSKAQLFVQGAPLHAFVANRSGLSQMLLPLMHSALAVVPVAQREVTPLALRATSGLRLLSLDEADKLLDDTRLVLEPFGFKDAEARILDGRDEGVYMWLTVNFLMGTIRPGMYRLEDPCAVIDFGAGAVQMAYWVKDSDAESAKSGGHADHIRLLELPFKRGKVQIYQQSYLGYGLMKARVKVLDNSDQGLSLSAHPCLPAGAHVTFQDRYTGRQFSATGASEVTECIAVATHILGKSMSCSSRGTPFAARCSFGGKWAGPDHSWQRLLLASYFFERMADVGVISPGVAQQRLTPDDYFTAARKACDAGATGLDSLATAFPKLSRESAAWLCFDLTYQAVLLTEGFGIMHNRSVLVAQAMALAPSSLTAPEAAVATVLASTATSWSVKPTERFELSWALGAAVGQLSTTM